MDPVTLLLIVLLAPLAAAALIAAFGRQRAGLAILFSVGSAAVQAALALWFLYGLWDGEPVAASLEWFALGDLTVSMGLYVNELAALMLMVVACVGFLIHLFAIGYSADDPARGRFFGGLSIFMFSMTGIVLADNLIMMFVFWELVGFSSYMLIGHYMHSEAAAASKKAFIVNRVGDFGFLIGIIWCYFAYGTVEFAGLAEATEGWRASFGDIGHPPTYIALLLFCGVLGKSAQMPLHVWLPDAMAGPTPVSALIHAATMVAAGVFLLGRTYVLFTPDALGIIAVVGVTTAAFAAFAAFGQKDIKKILAYSTLSQLGYMVAAFAFGTTYGLLPEVHAEHGLNPALYGVGAAMFHLTTHAFFKALLFLGAGSVIHACHHEQDIYKMGGLAKKMPVTFITFAIAVLAIAGIPGLAGFYSKDAILYIAGEMSPVAFWVLTGTALLTAMYMGRLLFVAFFGKPRTEHAEHAHESGLVMLVPLIVLAVASIIGGGAWLHWYPAPLGEFFHHAVPHPHGEDASMLLIVSSIVGGGGLVLAFLLYFLPGASRDTLEAKARPVFLFLQNRLWFDEIYGAYVHQVQDRVAAMLAWLEQLILRLGIVRLSAVLAEEAGSALRRLQTGSLHGYVYWFIGGVVVFWLFATGVLS